ncbi:signal peptidase II [Umezawaea tangerina]|uniref:Lipoprotein signal peptidase n=1 Tax=Umezawaea tangerina TaxID=84725 RepID=A0A2T0T9C3_9PSEU|nr:signal peptidase II [Umezawaea tangerina]
MLTVAALVLAVDQATKYWAESALAGRPPVQVVGDFLQFRLLYNPGAAFSIGTGSTWVFTVLAAIAAVVLLRLATQPQTPSRAIALALLLGGAVTHLLDRLFRAPGFARGHVVDFIDYNGFFVGNVADIALFAGAVLFVVLTFRSDREAERASQGEKAEDEKTAEN